MTDHSTPQDDADAADPTRQKLESLFQMLRGSDGPTPGDSNAVSQRFRLLRRHASGGLGDIWIAHDEELNREVALKEIQPQFAGHEQSWSRFLREATITGQLEHPGIVPIYALGHHENGQPFYAMRFVQGDTLADAIARFHRREDAASPPTERNLQRRKLITRLIDVCNAVAYAHSRSIIHRDLKPANIMLGEFGETLVVDWGLAKSLAEVADETQPPAANVAESLRDSDDPGCRATRLRETPPTQIGSAIGSPPYMSPEQAAGRLDELGPASDIYSLGATLFELLTGQSPIGATPAGEPRETLSIKDLLQRIQEGRFPRPSTVTPDVPRALEAVCLKAMSLRPADRYASARDLASDLEAWLADEPVTAWTEPLTIRARRWMRRHQTAVVSTAATALVAIIALSVLAFVVTDRNERLATAKGNLERSNNQLAETNRELDASNQREREQTKLANQRADELARTNQELKAATEREKTEAANVQRWAAENVAVLKFFYDNVLSAARPTANGGLGSQTSVVAALDAAAAKIRSLGNQPRMEASVRLLFAQTYLDVADPKSAAAQCDHLWGVVSELPGTEEERAKIELQIAPLFVRAYLDAGEFEKAKPFIERSLDSLRETNGPDHPDTIEVIQKVVAAFQTANRFDLALPYLKETFERQSAVLGVDHTDTLKTMRDFVVAHRMTGKLDQAVPLIEVAVEKLQNKLGPDDRVTLDNMNFLAMTYYANNQIQLAIPLYERTLEKQKATLGTDDLDTVFTMKSLANVYVSARRFDDGISLFDQTLKIEQQRFGVNDPIALTTMNSLGLTLQTAGKLEQALPIYEATLVKRKGNLGVDHADTLQSVHNLAWGYHAAGRFDEAEPLYVEAMIGFRRKFGFADSTTQACIANLIGCYEKLRQPQRAEPLWRELSAFWKDEAGLDSVEYAAPLASLSLNLLEQKKFTDAEPLIRECLTIREKRHPDHWTTFNTKSLLGGSLLGQKKYTDAEPLLLAGYEGMKQHEADIPAQGKIRLTEAIQRLVDLYDATDQKDKAAEWRTKLPMPTDGSNK